MLNQRLRDFLEQMEAVAAELEQLDLHAVCTSSGQLRLRRVLSLVQDHDDQVSAVASQLETLLNDDVPEDGTLSMEELMAYLMLLWPKSQQEDEKDTLAPLWSRQGAREALILSVFPNPTYTRQERLRVQAFVYALADTAFDFWLELDYIEPNGTAKQQQHSWRAFRRIAEREPDKWSLSATGLVFRSSFQAEHGTKKRYVWDPEAQARTKAILHAGIIKDLAARVAQSEGLELIQKVGEGGTEGLHTTALLPKSVRADQRSTAMSRLRKRLREQRGYLSERQRSNSISWRLTRLAKEVLEVL